MEIGSFYTNKGDKIKDSGFKQDKVETLYWEMNCTNIPNVIKQSTNPTKYSLTTNKRKK